MPAKYPLRQIGRNGPSVSAVGFGAMGINAFYGKKSSQEEVEKLLTYAYDRGVTFWDCADIYGEAEAMLGHWFKSNPEKRKGVFMATKFGSRKIGPEGIDMAYGPCSDPEYIKSAVERSLSRLQCTYIDLYFQHRVDPTVPIEIVMETLKPFVDSGKIKYLGLGECSEETLRRAKAVPGIGDKLIAVQSEFSLFSLDIERNGFIKAADELGVSIVAYSPLGRGMATGRFRSRSDFDKDDVRLMLPRWSEENWSKNLEVVDKILEIAKQHQFTPAQVTLAWILAEYPTMVPIPGSRSVERLEDNSVSAEITLPAGAIKQLRELADNAASADLGDRYPPIFAQHLDANTIKLSEWNGKRQD